MEIRLEIPDTFLEEEEWDRLKEFFNREEKEDLKEDFKKVIPAALSEYIDMFIGRGFPSRNEEIRQDRLFNLIKYYYGGKFPSESEVSSMFQETQTRCKSLIRLVLTRYRYDLKEELENAIIDTICAVKHNDSEDDPAYHVTIPSGIIVEELNRILNKEVPTYLNVRKIPGTGIRYSISEASYCKLKELYCPVEEECSDCPGIRCNEED